ncbi:MAG: hypothetical protein COT89_02420 [Candidatus Colwellbacteria bacterium CG10_big_fil_rev_8_21_14_0_10_42_22]|uniref:Uncharacterized protein n=1 Tax=Candidatus Colwellbacteria bacterium CG10_big_fil_rev_8_21_14_0_10_42_22 TaxID=1974540 RepID=A0A2H0VFL2_9BACT|nr:MAG: hypothetical protein COT89_02420 [Candidatus Colwellbacteria bacterium CG10_big_fil_rev_8_21_14_0_10_42_22]
MKPIDLDFVGRAFEKFECSADLIDPDVCACIEIVEEHFKAIGASIADSSTEWECNAGGRAPGGDLRVNGLLEYICPFCGQELDDCGGSYVVEVRIAPPENEKWFSEAEDEDEN